MNIVYYDPPLPMDLGFLCSNASSSNTLGYLGKSRPLSTSTASHLPRTSRAPLPYKSLPNRPPQSCQQAVSEDIDFFEPTAGSHDEFDLGTGEQMQDISLSSAPVVKSCSSLEPLLTALKWEPAFAKPHVDTSSIKTESPRPKEYIAVFEDVDAAVKINVKSPPAVKQPADIIKATDQSFLRSKRTTTGTELQTPPVEVLSTGKSLLVTRASSNGLKLPFRLAADGKRTFTEDDRGVQLAVEDHILGCYESKLPGRVEEITNVRPAPSPSCSWFRQLQDSEKKRTFDLMYGKDAKPF